MYYYFYRRRNVRIPTIPSLSILNERNIGRPIIISFLLCCAVQKVIFRSDITSSINSRRSRRQGSRPHSEEREACPPQTIISERCIFISNLLLFLIMSSLKFTLNQLFSYQRSTGASATVNIQFIHKYFDDFCFV